MRTTVSIATGFLLVAPLFAAEPGATDESKPELETITVPEGVVRIAETDPVDVDIRALDSGIVCERYVPTGSRISATRCVTRSNEELAESERKIVRQDIEAMRRQQMDRALMRQRSIEAFARQMRAAGATN
jgi:hypothetical protein